jgi:hypothetical protein
MKWPCSGPNAPSALPSTSNRRSSACRTLTAYCGGWRRCACLDAKTRGLAVRALPSTTCNNFNADLLFLSEVSHPFLVAGPPCVHPYLGKSALGQWLWGAVGGRSCASAATCGSRAAGASASALLQFEWRRKTRGAQASCFRA